MRIGVFTKRPLQVEAVQLTGRNLAAVAAWSDGLYTHDAVLIPTLEGTMRAELGDWVVRGVAGEFYPVQQHIFRDSYDQVA